MRFFLASFAKDLRLAAGDRWGFLIALAVPAALIGLMVVIFGGEKITPKGLLLIADQDSSLVSRLLKSTFSQGQLAGMITTEEVQEEAGRARINRGDGSALLIIPSGFGAAFLERRPAALTLLENPSEEILPSIIEEVLSIAADGGFYIQNALGESFEGLQSNVGPAQVSALSLAGYQLANKVNRFTSPPRIALEERVVETGRRTSFAALMFPGVLMLALLFTSQTVAAEVWKEREQGVLRRILASPSSSAGWLAGKIAAAGVVFSIIVAGALLAARWALHLRPDQPFMLLAWTVYAGMMLFLFITAVQFLASNSRNASVFTTLFVMPLSIAGGSMWPLDFFPPALARIGRLTPNGAAVEQMRAIADGRFDWTTFAVTAAALTLLGLAAFAISLAALRRGFGLED